MLGPSAWLPGLKNCHYLPRLCPQAPHLGNPTELLCVGAGDSLSKVNIFNSIFYVALVCHILFVCFHP